MRKCFSIERPAVLWLSTFGTFREYNFCELSRFLQPSKPSLYFGSWNGLEKSAIAVFLGQDSRDWNKRHWLIKRLLLNNQTQLIIYVLYHDALFAQTNCSDEWYHWIKIQTGFEPDKHRGKKSWQEQTNALLGENYYPKNK